MFFELSAHACLNLSVSALIVAIPDIQKSTRMKLFVSLVAILLISKTLGDAHFNLRKDNPDKDAESITMVQQRFLTWPASRPRNKHESTFVASIRPIQLHFVMSASSETRFKTRTCWVLAKQIATRATCVPKEPFATMVSARAFAET